MTFPCIVGCRRLLDDETTLITRGRRDLADGWARVATMTASLTAGISPERLQVAREVLDIIRANAEEELIALRRVRS